MAGPALARDGHPAQIEIADVAVQPFDPTDAEVVPPEPLPPGQLPGPVILRFPGPATRPGGGRRHVTEHQRQVPVTGNLPQLPGDQLGERDLVQLVVLARRQPGLNRGGGLLGQLREHVAGPHQRQGPGHDLPPRQPLCAEGTIDRLTQAFVQGLLAKDEFDLRVSQAFASRTFADLAALTADIPAGLTGAQRSPEPLPEPANRRAIKAIACVTAAAWGMFAAAVMAAAAADGSPLEGLVIAFVFIPG
jgi:Domain of unknown function (DUF1707)